jgi:hypothetical protein
MASDRQQSIDLEVERVRLHIETQLNEQLSDGSIGNTINIIDHRNDEWWFVANTNYHVSAATSVISMLKREFSMEAAECDPYVRPVYSSYHHFNIKSSIREEQRRGYMTSFYFRFLKDPTATTIQ